MGRLFWLFVGTIVYTYLGYPLLLTLLAKLRPGPRIKRTADTPSVTLLIAAYNEEAVIAGKIENSLSLDYPGDLLQILVVTDGCDDRTPEIVTTYADRGVELAYDPPRRGKMAAINRCMGMARGDIVVFSDANNLYAPNVLRELVAPFGDPTVGAVTGAKSISGSESALGESESLYWKYESYMLEQETRLGSCTGMAGEILAVRRDLYQAPPDDIINDDFFIGMSLIRRGYRVVYAPEARSYEPVSASAQDEITRRTRIIAGRYQSMMQGADLLPTDQPLVLWQVLSHKYMRPLVPLAMIGALVSNLAVVLVPPRRGTGSDLCRLAPPFNRIVLGLQVLFYGSAWMGRQEKQQGLLGRILYIPTFLLNSNLAALLGLYRYLTGQQTMLWQRVQRPLAEQHPTPAIGNSETQTNNSGTIDLSTCA